jgi:hypothetical protein
MVETSVVGEDLLVLYSLVLPHPYRVVPLTRQLAISLTTLRVRNPVPTVVFFCHGEIPGHLPQLAATSGATICEQPSYVDVVHGFAGLLVTLWPTT